MKTKEEILNKIDHYPNKEYANLFLQSNVYTAMDEHAKQMSIGFYNWTENENTEWRDFNGKEYTPEQLYKQYLIYTQSTQPCQ